MLHDEPLVSGSAQPPESVSHTRLLLIFAPPSAITVNLENPWRRSKHWPSVLGISEHQHVSPR